MFGHLLTVCLHIFAIVVLSITLLVSAADNSAAQPIALCLLVVLGMNMIRKLDD